MGTRSMIGRLNDDGTVAAIYCHWDGYISNNGVILHEHYQDAAKVDQLIALGDISSLGEEIGEKHDFGWRGKLIMANVDVDADPRSKMCDAYGRDRGEEGTEANVFPNEDTFYGDYKNYMAAYQYLYKNGEWFVKKCGKYSGRPVTPLAEAIERELD